MGYKERVLDYMKSCGSISSMEAFQDLGITRLSAVIFTLKQDGWQIQTQTEKAKNRFGKTIYYARYSLV